MINRILIKQRLWKKIGRTSLCLLLAISLLITGIPFFPGMGIKTVNAATTVDVYPNNLVTVYGGLTDISWNYGDKTHSSTLERCEIESIPPAFEPYENTEGVMIHPPTHAKDSLGFIGSKGPGLLGDEESFKWDGKVDGQPLTDGKYIVCVEPSEDPEYFGFGEMEVLNPAPAAPAYIWVKPSLDANGQKNGHFIRGIAENGTKVTLNIEYTMRDGIHQKPNPGANRVLEVDVPIGKMPDESHLDWSDDLPFESYFTDFPHRMDNIPEQYIREWEVLVDLEEYQIARITASVERTTANPYYNEVDAGKNNSGVSREIKVLRYVAPGWDINWEALAGYYYKAETVDSMIEGAKRIAEDNGIEIEVCTDGQRCPGFITKGWNFIIQDPELAGEITQKEFEEDLTFEKITNRKNYPSPLWWDPINLATGDFVFSHTNMSLMAIVPLDFALTYHSRDKYDGAVGVGWHHSYEWRLVPYGEGTIKVITPDGANYVFEEAENGNYRTPSGTFETLTQLADGTFELVTPKKWTYSFREDGMLYQMTDANGNVVSLTYEGAVLKRVETTGAFMKFDYGAAGKISTVTDHTGRQVSYQYDALTHDLLTMELPDSAVIRYEYDDKHQMTRINNPNETTELENRYDAEGRVVYQQDFSGAAGTIQYNSEARRTVTTDPLQREKTFEFDERFRKTAIHYPDGSIERFSYDSNDKMTQYIDQNEEIWTYSYDVFGNLTQQVDPLGNTMTLRYNEWNKPKQITDALGNVTTLGYDGRGNMTSVIDALGYVSTIERDGRGVITAMVNAEGERTTLSNDDDGFVRLITDPEGYTQELVRNSLHHVTKLIDPLQHMTEIIYDPRDRVKEQINALGYKNQYSYDKDSNLVQYTDVSGAITSHHYDKFDRLVSVVDDLGHTTTMDYDVMGNVIERKDSNGAVTEYKYDEVDRLIEMIDPEGGITRFTYDANRNLLMSTDPEGGIIEMTYDARNLPITVKDAEGAVTTYSYDALGRLVKETNDLGHAVIYEYDELGQIVKITDALNHSSSFEYDKAGRLVKTTNPNGAVWQMHYDARGLMTAVTDPLGNQTKTVYDALGRAVQSIDEEGNVTHYTYDPLGRVTSILDSLGQHTTFSYDQRGQIKEVKDAKQQVTSYDYDAIGRLVAVTNALNQPTSYNYDAVGNILSKTDANQNVTTYQYDKNNQLTREMNPLGELTELAYDHNGNVTDILYPDGKSTGYDYDQMNRLASILYPDHKQVGYSYDTLGRRTSMTDEHGTTTYGYDVLNRFTEITNAANQTIQYEWTATGQRSRVIYPDQSAVAYDYDLMDRMIRVTDGNGGIASYSYDKRGLLQTKTLPTQATSTYEYDTLGQLQELKHTNQRGKVMEHLLYEYDPVGNRIRYERIEEGNDEDDEDASESQEAIINEYAYDALNQLIEVNTQNKNQPESLVTTNYSYDSVGNRLSKESTWGQLVDTETYSYDGADKLKHWNNGANYKDFTYDKRGNLLKIFGVVGADNFNPLVNDGELLTVTNQVYDPTVTNGVYDPTNPDDIFQMFTSSEPPEPEVLEKYGWDSANRLQRHTNPWGDVSQYFYDGDNNRIKMTVDVARGPNGRGNNGNGNGNGNNNGNNGNGNGNNGNGNGNPKCHVVPPGFIPPGLAKKCGDMEEEPYPSDHPGGPREGWEKQHKKKHWEFHYTNDVSLALPEVIQATDKSQLTSEEPYYKWKETYAYGAGQERISMTYLPAYDPNNGWEPTPGDGGAGPDATPKTLYYLNDALGSVLGLVERDGRVSSRYHYDEFGIVSDQKKFDVNWPGPDNLYGYTGLGYDYYSDLTYARARYYKPELGRFISEDTYKGDIWNPQSQNGYAYVMNNPLIYIDPSGYKGESAEVFNINIQINMYKQMWQDYHNDYLKYKDSDNVSDKEYSKIALENTYWSATYANNLRIKYSHLEGLLQSSDPLQTIQHLEYEVLENVTKQITVRIDNQGEVIYGLPSNSKDLKDQVYTQSVFNYYHGVISNFGIDQTIDYISKTVPIVGPTIKIGYDNSLGATKPAPIGETRTMGYFEQDGDIFHTVFVTNNGKVTEFDKWTLYDLSSREPSGLNFRLIRN